MPKKNGITWHDPQQGESVRFWDEQEKRIRTGKVTRPASGTGVATIQPVGWGDLSPVEVHVTHIEPLVCNCDACKPDHKRPLPMSKWVHGQRVTQTYHLPGYSGPTVYVGTIAPRPYHDSVFVEGLDGVWVEWDDTIPNNGGSWFWDHSIRSGGGSAHSPLYALDEKPLNLREAEEIQPEDLQAAADMYDRLAKA